MPDTSVVEARIEHIIDGTTMFVATRDGVTMKAPRTSPAQAVGDLVHVRVKARQTLLAQEVGEPGSLGDLTPPPPSVQQVMALIDKGLNASAVAPLPPPPKREYAATGNLQVPEMPTNYVPNPTFSKWLDSKFRMSDHGLYVRCEVSGDTGTGKTSGVLAECALRGRPVSFTEGGTISAPDDWFGRLAMDEKGTHFIPHPLIEGLETPGTVWIIDEASRVRTPQAFNTLMGLLSDLRSAYCHELGRQIKVAPGVMVFCTMNIGPEYTGTTTQDRALRSRLSYKFKLDYLPVEAEERALVERCRIRPQVATSLVAFAWKLREQARAKALPFAPSTRTLIDVANVITYGDISPQEAVEEVVLPDYTDLDDDNEALTKVQATLQGVFASGQDHDIEQFGGGDDAQDIVF